MNDWSKERLHSKLILGCLVLGVPAFVLILLSTSGAVVHAESLLVGVFLVVVTAGVLFGTLFESRRVLRTTTVAARAVGESGRIVVAILGGTILTLAITIELGLSPVVAAGLVGIAAALVTPNAAVPAYCGAFVGMTSPDLFTTYWHAVLAGGVASAVYLLVQPVFHGIGGKLGTTAFVGAAITVVLTAGTFHSDPLPGGNTILLVVGYSAVGAVATFSLHTRLLSNPVLASGIVGVVGGVGLPALYGPPGGLMAAGVFAASFAGMTTRERIPDERWILLTGVIVGIVVVYTMPYLGGSGGKLGTIAFGSSLAVYGFLGRLHLVRLRRHLEDVPRRDVT